ncbi:hypothetical protein, partial [Candidatus Magnetobacterium casense]
QLYAIEDAGLIPLPREANILKGAGQRGYAVCGKSVFVVDPGTRAILKQMDFQHVVNAIAIDDASETLVVIENKDKIGDIQSPDVGQIRRCGYAKGSCERDNRPTERPDSCCVAVGAEADVAGSCQPWDHRPDRESTKTIVNPIGNMLSLRTNVELTVCMVN